MSANSFGQRLKMTTFGESHGPAYGVVIDGMPAGVHYQEKLLQDFLQRRKPGQGDHTTSRQEPDQPEVLSGVFAGKTLGTPIGIIIRNKDQRSEDYKALENNPRIGHADDVWKTKMGHVDLRGGGRSSGRETVCRVIAGAFAQMVLKETLPQVKVFSYARQIGPYQLEAHLGLPAHIKDFLKEAKEKGESYGGLAECRIQNLPAGLGQPIFHKLKTDLAAAMMSLGAVTGFEFGAGFSSIEKKGSDFHQSMHSSDYGGLRGGLSTGEEICFQVAFKPTSSIADIAKKGRHDPCIVPRALPVIEAMTWFVLVDHWLWSKTDRV